MDVTDNSSSKKKDVATMIDAYYASLSEHEQEGYAVATKMLGSTFDVVKTRGFLTWFVANQTSNEK